MSTYGRAIYNGRPYIAEEGKKDFLLRDVNDKKVLYLFKHGLGVNGDANVTLVNGGRGIAKFSGFDEEIESIRWMDDLHELEYSVTNGQLSVACPDFQYGQSLCVRVAEIKLK